MVPMPFYCLPGSPWRKDLAGDWPQIIHPQAREVGEQRSNWPAGDLVTMECPVCGHRWEVELPQ